VVGCGGVFLGWGGGVGLTEKNGYKEGPQRCEKGGSGKNLRLST